MNLKLPAMLGMALLLGSAPALLDAQAVPPPAPAKTMPASSPAMARHDHRGMHHRQGPGEHGVIGYLSQLERLYLASNRRNDLPALYQHVLSQSQDPQVREYCYRHLARFQARPANTDQAIATLRKGLDESLAAEAKRRAEREQVRAAWMQRAGKPAAPASK